MEHLVKLLRDSYDLQENKPEKSAYWHLQKLRSEIKQLTLTDVSQQRELLEAYTQFLWTQHNNLSNAENNEIALNKFIASNCG